MDSVEKLGTIAVMNDILDVDNLDNNKITTKLVRKKQKILTINVDEEWIENNFIDLPFIYYYQDKSVTNMIEYKWKSNDGLDRAIQVRSSIHGVPTPFEYDVLLALLRIHLRNNNNKIVIDGKMSNTIYFTFRELAKEMGFKGFGGKTKERLDKAIEVLCDSNIYNTAKGGLYDPVTKQYILDSKMSIGILHNYKTYSYVNTEDGVKLDKKSLKDKASVVIDEFFYRNINAGKGKISDKSLRQSLKIDLARRLYLIINKWRNNRDEMYITYAKLYERIPLTDEKSVSYRNKRIRSATEELVEKEYLESYEIEREGIRFKFKKSQKSSSDTTDLSKRYNTYTEIYDGFKKYGFEDSEINEYLTLDKIEYGSALLRYVDVHSSKIDRPKHYLIGSLLKNDRSILENDIYSNKEN